MPVYALYHRCVPPPPTPQCTAVPNFYEGIGDLNLDPRALEAGHYTDHAKVCGLVNMNYSFTFIWYL